MRQESSPPWVRQLLAAAIFILLLLGVPYLLRPVAQVLLAWGVLTAIDLLLGPHPRADCGILSFIPFLGPLLSAIPAVLVALTDSPTKALRVVAVFALVQMIESNLIPP